MTTRSVDDVPRIGSALAAPLAALALEPEEELPLPDDAALEDAEPPPPPPLRALTPDEPEEPVEDFPAELFADFSSACSSLFWVSRSLTMASSVLPELPVGGVVLSGFVVVVGTVVGGGVAAGVGVVGVVAVGVAIDGQFVASGVVVVVAGSFGHAALVLVLAGVLLAGVVAAACAVAGALEVVRATSSAWG